MSSDLAALADRAFADLASTYPARELTRVRGFFDHICGRTPLSFHPGQSSQVPPLHIPGLPAGPFLDRSLFPEAGTLEAAFDTIRRECRAFIDGTRSAVQYERTDKPMWPRWKKWVFYDGGPEKRNEDNCRAFPLTSGVIDRLVAAYPDFLSAGFLVHDGQVAIKPHVDWYNLYVSLWLPIYVPPGCGLEVGGERRVPIEGECLAFDNSYRHTSWNHSESPRIVLAIYRLTPHLTPIEIAAFIHIKRTFGHLLQQVIRPRAAETA